jgi:hypothetical protein
VSFIGQSDYKLDIVKGKVPGHESVSVFGVNPQVGSVTEDVWDAGGRLTYPTSGESWEVLSTDPQDIYLTGNGASLLHVSYLDEGYLEQSEIVLLSGTTAVNMTGNCFRFIRGIVLDAGVSGVNLGDIAFQVSGGGDLRGQINAENNNSLDGHYTVPTGKTAFLEFVFTNINKNEDIEIELESTIGDAGIFSKRFNLSIYQDSIVGNFPYPAAFTEKSDLRPIASSSDVNAKAVYAAQFVVIDNNLLDNGAGGQGFGV